MKKTWILVGLIMLIITSYEIIKSYAKYVSEEEEVKKKKREIIKIRKRLFLEISNLVNMGNLKVL